MEENSKELTESLKEENLEEEYGDVLSEDAEEAAEAAEPDELAKALICAEEYCMEAVHAETRNILRM